MKYCAEKSSRLKISDKILAQKNFTLLIKDKSVTIDSLLRWVYVCYCIQNKGSHFPQSYRGEPREARRARSVTLLFSPRQLASPWEIGKCKRLWYLTSPLSLGPVSLAACWTFPSGYNVCFSTCFSILVFPTSSSDLTSYPFIQTRTKWRLSHFLSSPSAHHWWRSPPSVGAPCLCPFPKPASTVQVQERTSYYVCSWTMLLMNVSRLHTYFPSNGIILPKHLSSSSSYHDY